MKLQNPSDYIFRCKTTEAFIFKVLIELLHNNIKTACFEISPENIILRMMDSNRRTLIDIVLNSKNFNMYYINTKTDSQNICIGVNLNHFYKMLKSIKKKDSLVLFIQEDRITDIGIQVIPKDFSRLTTSFVKIQNIQNLEIALPDKYDHDIMVSSTEFSKMCKDMFNMSNTISVNATRFNVRFSCNVGSVYSREVMLGDTEVDMTSQSDICFNDDFDTEQLSRILKIAGLNQNMMIHCRTDMPLHFETKVGNLGTISVYIKSKKQIEEEHLHADV